MAVVRPVKTNMASTLTMTRRRDWQTPITAAERLKPRVSDLQPQVLEALDYSWSANRHRRHLNSSQAALAESKAVGSQSR